MLKKTLIAASALTMATFAAAPAKADGFYFGFYGNGGGFGIHSDRHTPRYVQPRKVHRALSHKQIRKHLRHRGFRDFRKIKRRGGDYVVVAKARRGQLVRLRVNAYTGHIERRKRLRWN
ncbi:MAG: hypothetical protein ACSHYC_03100 [Alphaproteobacteria bacterium]